MFSTSLLDRIIKWKSRWGTIHSIELPGEPSGHCIYRSLTPLEFCYIRELMERDSTTTDWDTVVVSMALLYPTITEIKLPGTINVISSDILAASNPTEEELPNTIQAAQDWAKKTIDTNFSVNLALAIGNVYPSISLLDLLNSSTENLIQVAALIECATKVNIFKPSGSTKSSIKTAPLNPGAAATLGARAKGIETATESLRAEIERMRQKHHKTPK